MESELGAQGDIAGEGHGLDLGGLGRGDVPRPDHRREDEGSQLVGGFRVGDDVAARWRPDQPGQVGGLLQVEGADVLAVPGAGRGLDAVGAAPEVDGVDVALEDLPLVELALELDGDDRLPELAPQGGVGADVDVLDVLLGDRRPALGGALGPDVGPGGPGDADGIDAAVLEELAVLGGDDGVLDDGRHLVDAYREPVLLAVEGGQLGAGGVVDDRRLGLRGLGRQRDLGEDPDGAGQGGEHDQAEEEPHPPVAPEPARLLRRPPGGCGGPAVRPVRPRARRPGVARPARGSGSDRSRRGGGRLENRAAGWAHDRGRLQEAAGASHHTPGGTTPAPAPTSATGGCPR